MKCIDPHKQQSSHHFFTEEPHPLLSSRLQGALKSRPKRVALIGLFVNPVAQNRECLPVGI
jgi:hypothetical protein